MLSTTNKNIDRLNICADATGGHRGLENIVLESIYLVLCIFTVNKYL
jgi:hypothetical protein